MSSTGGGGGTPKRSRSASFTKPEAESPQQKLRQSSADNSLSRLLEPKLSGARASLFSFLDPLEAMRLSRTSKSWHQAVSGETIVPTVTGVRTNTTSGQRFWSTDPTSEDKRYFKPTSALGATHDVPHLSEQRGFASHATVVGTTNWPNPGSSQLPPGNYPTKAQFLAPVDARPPYQLGPMDLPKKAGDGRVLVSAPPEANEPPNTFILTKDYNRAKDVPSKGPLPDSRQRTTLSAQEASQPLSASEPQWKNARITGRDKP